MCLLCVEFDKASMSVAEARRALGEMQAGLPKRHVEEIEAKLDEAERALASADPNTP